MSIVKSKIHLEKVRRVFAGYVAKGWDTKGKLIVRMEGNDNIVYERIKKCGFDGMNLLDVGCATGRLLQFVNGKFKNCALTGIDVSSDMLEIAQKKCWTGQNRVGFILNDFMEYDFSGNVYDIIILKFVLHHMQDETGAIRKAVELLSPGGHLIVYVPGSRHFKEVLGLVDSEEDCLGRRTSAQLRELMCMSGAKSPDIELCEFRMQYKTYEDMIEFFRRTGMYQKMMSYEDDKWSENLNEEIKNRFENEMWHTGEYIMAVYMKPLLQKDESII